LEAAAGWYESVLWTKAEGAPGREYLQKRALTDATQRQARIGFAPGGWSRLVDYLHHQGYSPQLVEEAGLARPRKGGDGSYDVLRERVVIPIRDEKGRVIAFGGRLLEGDGPKYLNTPETRLYQKGKVLYGLDQARNAIQRTGRCLVVEGYFDVISLVQAGFGEVVATCGTALTPDHLERIRRLTRDVVLVLDSDKAGTAAAERTLPLFVDAGIQPWRLDLPGAKDPDELVREEGPEALQRALEAREPLFEWVVSRKLATYGSSGMSRERVLEDVIPMLRQLADPTLVSRVARRLGVHEEVVLQKIREAPAPSTEPSAEPADTTVPAWVPHRDVVHLLWLLVHRRDQTADLLAQASPDLLTAHAPVRPTLARLLSGEPVASVIDGLGDDALARTLRAVVARQDLYTPEQASSALVDILVRLLRPLIDAAVGALNERSRRAIAQGDIPTMSKANADKKALQDGQKRLDAALRDGPIDLAMDLLGQTAALAARSVGTSAAPT
jgi:DNA primase catalytic core